jgi:hypothetical protein
MTVLRAGLCGIVLWSAVSGCLDPAPRTAQTETPKPVPVAPDVAERAERLNLADRQVAWHDPGNQGALDLALRALKQDRGRRVALGDIPMARGLVVGDPLAKVKALFPQGPVVFAGGPGGFRMYHLYVVDPTPAVVTVVCVGTEVAVASEREVDRSDIERSGLEPYAWPEVPAELARMERENEANSRPRTSKGNC